MAHIGVMKAGRVRQGDQTGIAAKTAQRGSGLFVYGKQRRAVKGAVSHAPNVRAEAGRQKSEAFQTFWPDMFAERAAKAETGHAGRLQPGPFQQRCQRQRERRLDLEEFFHIGGGQPETGGQR